MQESTTTWDLRTIDYTIDGATKTYVFFLLVVVIWSVVTSLRFWWMTSAVRGHSEVDLSRLWSAFAQNDLEEVRRLSSRIAKRLPEYGISAWSNLKAQDSKSDYLECFWVAQVHFQYAVSRLQATGQNLLRLIVLTLIFACGWFFNHISLALKAVEASKAWGISALSGALGETAGLVSFTAFLLVFVFVVRWWVIARLERRKREWKRFAGMLQTMNTPRSGGPPTS